MKKNLLIAIFCLFTFTAFSQDFAFGDVSQEELNMKKYSKDTSAHAVALNEYGTSRIAFDNEYNVKLTFDYHTKIKFFDNKDFEREGTFEIPVYSSGSLRYEEVEGIKAVTYYKDENGVVQQVQLDSKNIFRTKENTHWSTIKFAMPALRSGCVIEVSYKVISPYLFNLHSWDFQGDIPKINSEYEVHIPGFWTYNAVLKGYLKLTKNTASIEKKCFTYGDGGFGTGSSADCSDLVFGMSDVPAFVKEDYMTSAKNFRSAVSFQLVESQDIVGGAKHRYTKEWKDIDYLLKTHDGFGSQLKRVSLFKQKILPVIEGKTDELAKSKAVYAYIKSAIKWNERVASVSVDGIKQALEKHTGNSADINIALIDALNAAGINTEAVLLSTRENGAVNKLYPDLDSFDYVIAKANIGDKSYFLDATDPLLPFGILPLRCLNDQGRVFSLDKPSYFIDMDKTLQRENVTYTYDLTLQDDGKIKGTISRYFVGYSGYLQRMAIKKYNTTDEYLESLQGDLHKIKILKSEYSNIDSLDLPLGETYEVEINAYDNLNHNRLAFDPFILNKLTTNPFKLAERDYPVDWGMPSDERYVLTFHLPKQFTIENPPQNVAFGLPDNGGRFFTDFQVSDNTIVFSHVTKFTKSVYSANEYPYLKELYNKIILSQKNELVFKKKS